MARITKTDIYAKHGIEFKKEGNKELIYCKPIDKWINKLIPVGTNTKIGKKAGTWSMTHGNETVNIIDMHVKMQEIMKLVNLTEITYSCPIHCDDCYCDNGCYNFPDNKAKNLLKLILAKYFLEWLERALTAQIEADKITQIRIHAAGDFFSIEYTMMWKRIANRFEKQTIFWTYTKVEFALDILKDIPNLLIVPSITACGFNFGTCKELLYRYNKLTKLGYRVHICACGTPIEKELDIHCCTCKHGCKAIRTECDYVLFIKHSTNDYKAGEKDPVEFAKICEIIAKQNN